MCVALTVKDIVLPGHFSIRFSVVSPERGADLANLLNEGAIMAARRAKSEMDSDDAWQCGSWCWKWLFRITSLGCLMR